MPPRPNGGAHLRLASRVRSLARGFWLCPPFLFLPFLLSLIFLSCSQRWSDILIRIQKTVDATPKPATTPRGGVGCALVRLYLLSKELSPEQGSPNARPLQSTIQHGLEISSRCRNKLAQRRTPPPPARPPAFVATFVAFVSCPVFSILKKDPQRNQPLAGRNFCSMIPIQKKGPSKVPGSSGDQVLRRCFSGFLHLSIHTI